MSLHMFVYKLIARYYEHKSATVEEFNDKKKNFLKLFTYGGNITSVVLILTSCIMMYYVWLDIFTDENHVGLLLFIGLIVFGVLKFLFDIGMVVLFIKLIKFF